MTSRLGAALLGLALAAAVAAPAARAGDDDAWEFNVTPYVWATGLKGEVAPFPALQPVRVDQSFSDAVKDLKFAFAGVAEAHRGHWSFLTDISYDDVNVSQEHVTTPDPAFIAAALKTKTITSTVAAGYRVAQSESYFVDALAGARISWADNEVTLRRANNTTLSADHSETWVDPVIGVRGQVLLSPRWSVSAYGDVGGFGVSSKSTYQVYGGFNYQLNEVVSLSAGYRYYAVDFENGGFVYDVTQQGPILAAGFHF